MTTKAKKLRCLIVLLAVLSCFGGCIQHNPADGEKEESGTLPRFEGVTVKEYHKLRYTFIKPRWTRQPLSPA